MRFSFDLTLLCGTSRVFVARYYHLYGAISIWYKVFVVFAVLLVVLSIFFFFLIWTIDAVITVVKQFD